MILVNIMGTWKVKKLYWNVLLVSFPTACGGIWLFSKCICVHRSSHSQWELAATGAGAHTRGGSSRRPGQELTLAATGAVAHTRSDRGRSSHSQWELAATGAGAHTRSDLGRSSHSQRPGQEHTPRWELAATGVLIISWHGYRPSALPRCCPTTSYFSSHWAIPLSYNGLPLSYARISTRSSHWNIPLSY